MSALPFREHGESAAAAEPLSQDDAHQQVRDVLAAAVDAVLDVDSSLYTWEEARPQRDRNSGTTWSGIETMCHVSALLVGIDTGQPSDLARARAVDAVGRAVADLGFDHAPQAPDGTYVWTDAKGARLDLVAGERLALRAYSAPFLPGSLQELRTTSPITPISPLTPPPRQPH